MLRKSIDVLTKFTGRKPKGFTAPAWTPSRETVCCFFLGVEWTVVERVRGRRRLWYPGCGESAHNDAC